MQSLFAKPRFRVWKATKPRFGFGFGKMAIARQLEGMKLIRSDVGYSVPVPNRILRLE